MCGIAGIIDLKNDVPRELVKRMTDIITHRGPDADGFYFGDGIGLGHRRLSIIDLDCGGQPLHNEDKSIWVIFNGEIYNYKELTAKLKKSGHTFQTNSDTETIAHLYEDYGDDCVKHLRGMFAFALWDEKKKKLLLARDRVGKKPISYYYRPGKLVFGSEIKSIILDKSIHLSIGDDRVDQYLKFGYIPSPNSIYNEIQKLNPGHILVYENDIIKTKRYWDFEYSDDGPTDEVEIIEEIERKVFEAINLRMISDVPLGAFLSGGVDSSLIVAMMSKLTDRPVKTFTIGFEEDDFSETKYARQVAEHLNTDHYEEILRPDINEVLQELLFQYDEPFADSSMIPTYLVSKLARKHVTVALSGDGGDEIFAGYNRYTKLESAKALDFIPGIKTMARIASAMPFTSASARRKLKIIAKPSGVRQLALSHVTSDEFRTAVYADQFRESLGSIELSEPEELYLGQKERLNKWQYSDIHAYLPNDILVKVDRASMLSSLETRAPFLDHHLIEYMATIPEKLRTKNKTGKYLLKKLAEKYIPTEIIYRPKMGFMIPANHWFKGPLKPVIHETLLSEKAQIKRYLKQDIVKGIISEHLENRMDNSLAIYSLLYLELWLERYAPNG